MCYRHQLQARHPIPPHQEANMDNRVQVLKTPINILQLTSDKRTHFPSPGLLTFNNVNSQRQFLKLKPWLSSLRASFVQIQLSQFPSPQCQTTSPSRRRGPHTASRSRFPTTATTPASLTASSTKTPSSSAPARSPARLQTPPFPRVSRMVPRR